MSLLPAFVNAVFTLNQKGEYPLYEGHIEGGFTKVTLITNVAQGYNVRYYKIKQIIALEGQQAIKQSFDLPSQEFAYKIIERAIIDKINSGEDNEGKEEISVVVTGQHSKTNPVNTTGVAESHNIRVNTDNSDNSYQSVVASQSRKLTESSNSREINEREVFGNTSFDDLAFATRTTSNFEQEFFGGVKIANLSSFTNESSSNRNGDSAGYNKLESMLDSNW
ncbi:MAG: hypothetical protein IJH34_05980 [Romboutsia sp.]|nr:hypothetical protein [Romboutsia sp.]